MSDRVQQALKDLSRDDLAVLRDCVEYVGGYEGGSFKTPLMGALERGHDMPRRSRLIVAVKHLSEAEILALCEGD
ncbi:MAG TPA: hypothetical protein VGI81_05635 [Tepidisphaeraceae bacterium]|jgi:hypothetical protein